MATEAAPSRRWDLGAWLTLATALVVWAWYALTLSAAWSVPTEGWIVQQAGPGEVGLEFVAPTVDGTGLEPGDQLLTIEGVQLETIVERAHAFFRLTPPDWQAGTVLRYTVLRADAQLTASGPVTTSLPVSVDVTLVRLSMWPVYRATLTAGGPAAWVQLAGALFFFVVGVVVFWLRPQERAARALFLVAVGFLGNGVYFPNGATHYFYPLLAIPNSIPFDTWTMLINPSLAYLVLVFPSPKWPVRRHPWLTVAVIYLGSAVALNSAYRLNLENRAGYDAAATVIYLSGVAFTILTVIGGLIHSAVTLRAPGMRAQLRWMAVGMVSFVVVGIGAWALRFVLGGSASVLGVMGFIGQLGWFLLPTCLAVAILRYRLFDIDVIIRRTLVYSALSAVLALAYLGSVLVLQNVFRAVTGERQNALVTVLSTLTIAALFGPLRSRVQRAIDRRFYRQKYDAARTLLAFGAQARDVVEIEQLSSQLVQAVDETMQPAHVGLWVRKAAERPRG